MNKCIDLMCNYLFSALDNRPTIEAIPLYNKPLYNKPLDNTLLDNIVNLERKEPDSEDEGLVSDASALENRHIQDPESRQEYREKLKRIFNVDPDNSEDERTCAALQKTVERTYKKRKLERDEYNDMVGVEDIGPSTSVSPMSMDSDHKQMMEDDRDFLKKKEDEYREENRHREDYSEEDAKIYARNCLNEVLDELDNPETDDSETNHEDEGGCEAESEYESSSSDNGSDKGTNHEDEGGCEADSEYESSSSDNGSDKGTNISTKIKDLIRKSGGSGGVSSGGSDGFAGGSNNNGGSDNGTSKFSILDKFITIFFSFIDLLFDVINSLFL
jgi:hypothetical protein